MDDRSYRTGVLGALILVAVAFLILGGIEIYELIESPEPVEPVTVVEHDLLLQVFPDADLFSATTGEYLHHQAYKANAETGENTLVGFVFLTTDVEPEERAYGGPIDILVGMTTAGVLTGIRVVKHREPWGPFSIERKDFAPQFVGKSLLDAFEVGRDIDAIARVTITLDGAARAIRKSARKVARQHLYE